MVENEIERLGSGEIGGKARGFLRLTRAVHEMIRHDDGRDYASVLAFPETRIISTSLFRDFLAFNQLEEAAHAVESGGAPFDEPLKARFREGAFPESDRSRLAASILRIEGPVAVRSSSLLEDQKRASFAGKYESVFVRNHGGEEERLLQLLQGIKEVYASTFNPSALAYRRNRGLLDTREEMALLVQEVVGRAYGHYWLPAMAGVGFSQNGYCWNREMLKKDGLVRLVFGLGTRAVGRGYVRLFSPAKPTMRPEGTEVNNIQKCSQKNVDVIDLQGKGLRSVHFRELITDGFNCYPGSQAMVSLRDGNYLYRPVSHLWDASHVPVLTMDGVLAGSWMNLDLPGTLGWLLRELEATLGFPVDLEFAVSVDPDAQAARVYPLQARPLAEAGDRQARSIPELDKGDVIFSTARSLPTAFVPDIEYLVYVDEDVYHAWPHNDRQSVARVVGKVTEALRGKRFALVGPGRWGSWNPQLGVPVSYAEIAGSLLLVEVARRRATYVPEVSYGSHFFQDLIEDNVAYLPLHPDEPNEVFNEAVLHATSELPRLLPGDYYRKYDRVIRVIHLPSIAHGRTAHAILNGQREVATVFLADQAPA
jgi:pyruvate,water dikinase